MPDVPSLLSSDYILLEDASGHIALEDSSGAILLETSSGGGPTDDGGEYIYYCHHKGIR
jgi:hypothetical protein